MRRKIVLWGANEKDEKILVALELLEKENVVNIYTFPETVATEEFYKAMADKWRNDEEVEFPEGFAKIERKLSITDSLLPDEIKVTSTDVVARAQAEWHVVVLSSKLYELYKSELEELKEKIDGVTHYDNAIWEELRTFWGKIQNQMNDRNLFREHGFSLKEKTNNLFDKLKEYKKTLENEYETQSKEYVAKFQAELKEIEDKIDKGLGLNPIFEDLKKVQQRINEFKFTKKDRDDVWAKIDTAFKKLKEKRSGGNSGQGGGGSFGLSGLENRYNGLVEAIAKMEKSVSFDNKDLEFETKRIANSDGQLETMLRQAKLNMINERLSSKSEKLADMHKTRAELEAKMEKEKKRMVKNEKNEKVEEAKETVKAKIAADIAANVAATENLSEKLEQAANDISAKRKPKAEAIAPVSVAVAVTADQVVEETVVTESKEEVASEEAPSIFEQLTESIANLVEDVQDNALAVAAVVGDKLEEMMEKAEEVLDKLEDKVEEKIQEFTDKKDEDESDKKSDISKDEE